MSGIAIPAMIANIGQYIKVGMIGGLLLSKKELSAIWMMLAVQTNGHLNPLEDEWQSRSELVCTVPFLSMIG